VLILTICTAVPRTWLAQPYHAAWTREGGGTGGGVAVVVSVAVVNVAGGRDDVEGETEALSFDVIRPRRSLLRGVLSKV
jgi:hypothetical protein